MEELNRGMVAQLQAFHAALDRGMPRVGWKVGLNFAEFRKRLGLDTPVTGWLDGERVLPTAARYAPPEGAMILAEVEIAIRVGGRDSDGEMVIAAIHPALELVNYARPRDGLADILAHSLFHEASVLGSEAKLADLPPLGEGLPKLHVNGELRAEARPGLVPADLREVPGFVADFLSRFGERLLPGDLILSGTYTDPVVLQPGDAIVGDFGEFGRVEVQLAGE